MFNINILPIHLVYGRNLGELPGLKVHPAPKNAVRSRASDLLIVLISIENGKVGAETLAEWNELIAASYFTARGSFTMGFTAAVRSFADTLQKEFRDREAPNVLLNLAVIRDRTMLVGHSGPVTTTVVCSDHVQNFQDMSSEGARQATEGLRFFQIELHSGDIIFLSPFVPSGWTNQSILEAMSSSPVNVIRYLLNQANGNLQCAVIQVKVGHGEISYRYKSPIVARVELGGAGPDEDDVYQPTPEEISEIEDRIRTAEEPARAPENGPAVPASSNRPLFRLRVPADPFPFTIQKRPLPENNAASDEENRRTRLEAMGKVEIPTFIGESEARRRSEINEPETRLEETGPSETPDEETGAPFQSARERVRAERRKRGTCPAAPPAARGPKPKRKRVPLKNVLFVLALTILIPAIVGVVVIGWYVSNSNQSSYRVNLSGAVSSAKIALAYDDPTLKRAAWEKVIEFLDEAKKFGSSNAASELRAQANESIDQLDNGIPIRYYYALAAFLPAETNLIKLEAAGDFLYGLDGTSGGILRFARSDKGFLADRTFRCGPGTYPSYADPEENDPISVGKIVDFTILPIENALDRILIGVDRTANVLYCSQNLQGAAGTIHPPVGGWGEISAIQFENRRLYLLDAGKNAIQSVPYLGKSGVGSDAESYFGSKGPPLYDVIDFKIIKTDVFLLRKNGGIDVCDYKGYAPDCDFVETVSSADGLRTFRIADRGFFDIQVNNAPDTSLYLFDRSRQSMINLTLKLNLVRYLVPDRSKSDATDETATAFTFFDRATPIWAAGNRLFVGTLP